MVTAENTISFPEDDLEKAHNIKAEAQQNWIMIEKIRDIDINILWKPDTQIIRFQEWEKNVKV